MLDRQTCRELGVPQYVKLPIPAYAIQILPENYDLLRREERLDLDQMQVKTLEGVFHYELGDYLVVGNSDEVWTVKQETFEATYRQTGGTPCTD